MREARDVDRLARKLEDAAGPITLKWTTSRSSPDKSTMDRLVSTQQVQQDDTLLIKLVIDMQLRTGHCVNITIR